MKKKKRDRRKTTELLWAETGFIESRLRREVKRDGTRGGEIWLQSAILKGRKCAKEK